MLENNCLSSGVTIIFFTFNNEIYIEECLSSLAGDYKQLIVFDGQSTDKTVEKCKKYTQEIFITDNSFSDRIKLIGKYANNNKILFIEADHIYPKKFVKNMEIELDNSEFIALQAKLSLRDPSTYLERGFQEFLELLYQEKDPSISGPAIWKTEQFLKLTKDVKSQGPSIDSEINDLCRKFNWQRAYSSITVIQNEKIDLKSIIEKFSWYGRGDSQFFHSNRLIWSNARRLYSFFYVPIKYFYMRPIKLIKNNKSKYVYFVLFIGLIRFTSFLISYIKLLVSR